MKNLVSAIKSAHQVLGFLTAAEKEVQLRSEELSADVERLTAENKLLKTNLKQTQEQLNIERKQSERERAAAAKQSEKIKGQGVDGLFPPGSQLTASRTVTMKLQEGLHKLTLAEKILLCLFQVDAPLTRNQVTFYTGLSPTSGPMCSAYAEALEAGWITQEKKAGPYKLTDAGAERLAELEVHAPELPSGRDIFEAFCKREGGVVETMARAIFSLGVGPGWLRQDIAARASEMKGKAVSHTSGPACSAFSRLQKLDVIEIRGRGAYYGFTSWVVAIVEPISVKVRDTSTGLERRVTVK